MLTVFQCSDEEICREVTQDVIADGFFTDPARFTVTVHYGITAGGRLGRQGGRAARRPATDRGRRRGAARDEVTLAGPGEPARVTDVLLGERDQALAAAAERAAKTAPGVLIDTDPLRGPAAQAVTECGSGAQMLVLGSRGIGAFTALLLGSVSRYAASHASCPVVVVRDEAPSPHGLVGVGVADLDTCGDALTFAFEEASLRKADLLVMHAWHTPQTDISRAGQAFTPPGPQADAADAARHLSGLLDEWRAKYPDVPVSQDVVHGHPGRALVGLSARADLVVVGRHAKHPGLPGAGSVRHAVLNHAHGPVATIPSA